MKKMPRLPFALCLGFSLIELLVVIAIIGILVGVGTASYQRAVKLSRDAKRKTDLEQIRQALETYRAENGTYPASSNWEAALENGYITNVPSDPRSNLYAYAVGTPATTYALCAALEVVPATPVGATCANESCGDDCNYQLDNP